MNCSLIESKKKLDRKYGANLWSRANSTYLKRPTRPGQHGANRKRKLSTYAQVLNEKQRLRVFYGLTEHAFRRFFERSSRKAGNKSVNFIALLESRLDATIFRAKWGNTIFAVKQLISHKHVQVNGRTVNISSYIVKPNDVISLSTKARNMGVVNTALSSTMREVPVYLGMGTDNYSFTYIRQPESLSEVVYARELNITPVTARYSRIV